MSFRLWTHLTMDDEGGGPGPGIYEANIAFADSDLYIYHFDSDTETVLQVATLDAPVGRRFVHCRWHPSGEWVTVCSINSALTNDAKTMVYSWDGATLVYVSETQPNNGDMQRISFSDDGDYAAIVTSNDGDRIYLYTFSAGTLTLIAGEPDILPGGTAYSAEWNSEGNLILTGGNAPIFYTRSGSTFTGTTYADPSSFHGDTGASWSFDAEYVAMRNNKPGAEVLVYEAGVLIEQLTTSTGLGEVGFKEDGTLLASSHGVTPYVAFFSVPSFSSVAYVGDALNGAGRYLWWAGDYLVVSHASTPFFSVLRHDGGGTFVTLSDPADLPGGAASFMHAIRLP